ncbi:MAG: peptidoglycan-binding protein [Oscillospiraceae bacterium]|jgi:peptidoglycan hydrolase-like protein with peptidoglycan-binding domain|nr:peptidoglycan-binding protein [Oscillospiraceae bacterium]
MPDTTKTPVIPESITVHLGKPGANARNVTLPFVEYIKNVASSEIYPTWPEEALKANILAEVTFALNRIFTEHYPSRGYPFDITSSTAYDQYFVENRNIFENISRLVDELFDDYVVKGTQIQPYFTQYCSGKSVKCDGLSQWGTVDLANRGMNALQILRNYYGNDIKIVENAPVRNIQESYPGTLRMGSVREDVAVIQRQLNRISANYPAIPKIPVVNGIFDGPTEASVKKFQSIFDLEADGIVGKSTWYKIERIYNAIKRLSELYSEGLTLNEVERVYKQLLALGDTGQEVKVVQYYLDFLSQFNRNLVPVTVDGIFGPQMREAVLAFQREYGLGADGLVGRSTWNRMLSAYTDVLQNLPDEYLTYSSLYYPGYFVTPGASGKVVQQVQTYLATIADNRSDVPAVVADGHYGAQTAEAVKAVQKISGLEPNGSVGPLTWNALINLYNEYR